MTDKMKNEYDTLIRRAGRIACHAPKTTSGGYIDGYLNLDKTGTVLSKLAKNYIKNENRCPTIQGMVANYIQPDTSKSRRARSPLDHLLNVE